MAGGGGDGLSAGEDAGSGDETVAHAVAEGLSGDATGGAVADGGDPGGEDPAAGLGAAEDGLGVGDALGVLDAGFTAAEGEVDMGVDEAGEDSGVGVVDDGHVRRRRGENGGGGAGGKDAALLDEKGGVRNEPGGAGEAGDEAGGTDDEGGRG